MKQLIIILLLTLPIACYAQWGTESNPNPAPVAAARLALNNTQDDVRAFNSYLLSMLPEYHLTDSNTTDKSEWGFVYNNSAKDMLYVSYAYNTAGNRLCKTLYLSGTENTVVDIYNKLFSPSISKEQLSMHNNKIGAFVSNKDNERFAWLVVDNLPSKKGYSYMRVELK